MMKKFLTFIYKYVVLVVCCTCIGYLLTISPFTYICIALFCWFTDKEKITWGDVMFSIESCESLFEIILVILLLILIFLTFPVIRLVNYLIS